MENNQFMLKIDGRLENLSVIADFIATTMKQLGVVAGLYEIQTAVDEACTNIIKYAYADGGGTIIISCARQDDDFIITIQDRGKPFDPGTVPQPDLGADPEERKIGGLGIYLMRQLMDEVSYNFNTETGNTLTMRKKVDFSS